MIRDYIKPEIEVSEMDVEVEILAGSGDASTPAAAQPTTFNDGSLLEFKINEGSTYSGTGI